MGARPSKSSRPSKGFKRVDGDTFIVAFSPSEREVLLNLSGQLIEILAERVDVVDEDPLAEMVGITGHDSPPDDAVLLRLLPNAYADPVESAEFRRYTESTLRSKKREHAMNMRTLLLEDDSNISLNGQGAQAWLGAINDIRLALGVRLNVEDNSYQRFELLSPEDPMQAVFAVYSWLGWLQESLINSLMVSE
ncbi:MAG TPA: DUF2017 domain-containing protein [Candidatus Paceibacterota bacterium]|nr:DUF2017 domain-containing protein [Candidatus Paceibacterota bacterium]